MSELKKETRIKRTYRLKEETLNKINVVKMQRQVNNATEAIEYMIDQYFMNQAKQYEVLMVLFERLLDKKLDEKLDPIKSIEINIK